MDVGLQANGHGTCRFESDTCTYTVTRGGFQALNQKLITGKISDSFSGVEVPDIGRLVSQ